MVSEMWAAVIVCFAERAGEVFLDAVAMALLFPQCHHGFSRCIHFRHVFIRSNLKVKGIQRLLSYVTWNGLSEIVWDRKSSSVAEAAGCMCSLDNRGQPGKRAPCCYECRILKLYSHRITFLWSLLLGIIFVMIKIYFCHMVLLCQLTIHSCIFSLLRDLSHLRRSFRHLYPQPQIPAYSEVIPSQL